MWSCLSTSALMYKISSCEELPWGIRVRSEATVTKYDNGKSCKWWFSLVHNQTVVIWIIHWSRGEYSSAIICSESCRSPIMIQGVPDEIIEQICMLRTSSSTMTRRLTHVIIRVVEDEEVHFMNYREWQEEFLHCLWNHGISAYVSIIIKVNLSVIIYEYHLDKSKN